MVGAFFLALALLTSCKKQSRETADWILPAQEEETVHYEEPLTTVSEKKARTPSGDEVRFLSYNLKNYLTMRRGKQYLPKPAEEVSAVIELIAQEKPDILGLCEIGTEDDLRELQRLLKNKGIDLPHSEHTGGRDQTRHLAILSRYPIIQTDSQRNLSYEMTGERWVISRGILDATIEIVAGNQIRFLGVHLKSKREIKEADQELIRQNEARLLRLHMDEILEKEPNTRLLAYGDFNDTIGSRTLSISRGRRNSKKHMADFYFKDSRGELWTHFWDYQDTYARLDYVLFSPNLRSHLVGKKSYIVDHDLWNKASDHRALMLVLTP